MPGVEEIVTSVPKAEAVAMAEIHAMRQMADAVSAQTQFFGEAMAAHTRAVERLADEIQKIDRRLIRVEEAKHGRDIEKLTGRIDDACQRIDDLETIRDRQAGALSVGGWISKYAPWLVALVMAGLAGLGFRGVAS